jgi:hypothetical protein
LHTRCWTGAGPESFAVLGYGWSLPARFGRSSVGRAEARRLSARS